MNDLLNEPQRRSLEVNLRTLEETLERSRALRAAAQHGEEDGVLIHWRVRLSPEQQMQLQKCEAAAMEQLRILRDEFDLSRMDLEAQRKLASAFSILWADLKGLEPERWVGNGALNTKAKNLLQPAIKNLEATVANFVDILEKKSESG